MDKNDFSSFLTALRKSSGMTQREAAQLLNVSNKTVSKWECGEGYPEIMMLPALAELYHVTVDELLNGRRAEEPDVGEEQPAGNIPDGLLDKAMLRHKNSTVGNAALMGLAFGLFFLFQTNFLTSIWPIWRNRQVLASCIPAVLALLLQILSANRAMDVLRRWEAKLDQNEFIAYHRRIYKSFLLILYLVLVLLCGDFFTVWTTSIPYAGYLCALLLPAAACILLSVPIKKYWMKEVRGSESLKQKLFWKKLKKVIWITSAVTLAAVLVPSLFIWTKNYMAPEVYSFAQERDYRLSKAAFEQSAGRLLVENATGLVTVHTADGTSAVMMSTDGGFGEIVEEELRRMAATASGDALDCSFQDESRSVTLKKPVAAQRFALDLAKEIGFLLVVWFDLEALLTGAGALIVWKKVQGNNK